MGKQGKQAKSAQTKNASITSSSSSSPYKFPNSSIFSGKKPRKLGNPTTLAPAQILLFDSTLLPEECRALIDLFASSSSSSSSSGKESAASKEGKLKMKPSPAARRGEALRTNDRFSTTDPDFAAALYTHTGLADACTSHLTPIPTTADGRKPIGLSANIRVYRYEPGSIFGPHYDDYSTDPISGLRTEWTLLVYLTGEQDGVEGGQTVFYPDHAKPTAGGGDRSKATRDSIVAPLVRGTALLHRHGQSCMLHEAMPPTKGTKWVLRSDVVFGR